MSATVYSVAAHIRKCGPVRASVYKKAVCLQPDTRNHNPRVGGSSPSSATSFSNTYGAFLGSFLGRFTLDCKLSRPRKGAKPERRRRVAAPFTSTRWRSHAPNSLSQQENTDVQG